MTAAPQRLMTILERYRGPTHEPPALQPASAAAALAHGDLPAGDAICRRGNGLDDHAQVSDARVDPQIAGDRHSRARAAPSRRAPALWCPDVARRTSRADEARRLPVALCLLSPDDRDAADRLGYAVGGGISRGGVR